MSKTDFCNIDRITAFESYVILNTSKTVGGSFVLTGGFESYVILNDLFWLTIDVVSFLLTKNS